MRQRWTHLPIALPFETRLLHVNILQINFCLIAVKSTVLVICRRGTELAHVGACMKVTLETNCTDQCPEQQQTDLPVCGSDGNVYR